MADRFTPWGTILTVEVSSASPGEDPLWVDITEQVRPDWDAAGGRQNELGTDEPDVAALLLLNDGRFTTGNPTSAYPWWRQGRRLRIRETIGYYTYDLYDGFIQRPRGTNRIDVAGEAAPQDAVVGLSAVDLLGRLSSTRRFLSTLGEHIRFHGGPALKAHWTLADDLPFTSSASPLLPVVTTAYHPNFIGAVTSADGEPSLTARGQEGPAGEDVSFAEYGIEIASVGGIPRISRAQLSGAAVPSGVMALTPGQVLTLVAWVWVDDRLDPFESDVLAVRYTDPVVGVLTLTKQDNAGVPFTGTWLAEVNGGSFSASTAGGIVPTARWTLVALRIGFTPNTFELWVDGVQTVGTLTGSGPTQVDVTDVFFPFKGFAGSIGHAQVYLGSAADWTFADFTAQRAAGLTGLERQSTGERINTVADYAGIPPAARDIDRGVAVMSRALLSNRRATDLFDEANATEQGRLYVRSGLLTFRDRRAVHDL